MNVLDSYAQAQDQLSNLSPAIRLVILHPDFHGQHRLFAPILRQPASDTLYLALDQPNTSLNALLGQLQANLQTQLGNELADFPGSPENAAQVVCDLMQRTKQCNLVIDAFDLTIQEETAPFIAACVDHMPEGCRVYLGTRILPMQLLESNDVRGKVALIPVNPDRMMLDYAQSGEKNVLEVRALGPGRVLINGRLIEHWDGILPRTLFFYFVDRGMTTRDEIFNTFWPNLSTREATNVFHVTKRKISEILGADLTVYWSGFYRISPDLELHYDVVKFAEAVQNAAVASDTQAMVLLRDAIALYNGPFLSSFDHDWVTSRREELGASYAEALAGLARIFKMQETPHNALGYYLRAAATSPQREDLARAIMELYQDLGLPEHALDTYDRLEAELRDKLKVQPGPQTIELADTIRASLM